MYEAPKTRFQAMAKERAESGKSRDNAADRATYWQEIREQLTGDTQPTPLADALRDADQWARLNELLAAAKARRDEDVA